jgi:hypothetical protein
MNRVTGFLLAGATLLALTGARPAHAKKATLLTAERAGWMMGMYVGEKKESPYPFIIQVDKDSDAYRKGLREGDELIRFNTFETNPLWRIFDEVNRIRPDREVIIWVRRGAETQRFFVRMPKDPGAPPGDKGGDATATDKKKTDDQSADASDDKNKKKKKNKPPVVVKPIPADGNGS